ncbi:TrmH family RNA methyltransferase [Bifidobacterium miconisargentati]|uniref:TrmH family RNA methyltransferase n=1 Tax=Bifidobacterium miconisargentati TaxID=2834437 RepID=UPI001BDD1594|nr:RNA methyltransferase [Bifidobacterium miconisargentati]MBW3089336.1 RNA methyltransferase [Bifidobacterium miconisargentati]
MPINAQILDNPKSDRVRRIADLTRSKGRERSGRFLIEGPQSVREAVTWRPDVVQDLYVEVSQALDHPRIVSSTLAKIVEKSQDATIYVHQCTGEVIRRISPDSQGILAVGNARAMRVDVADFEIDGGRSGGPGDSADSGKPLNIAAFWQVRDPGNAGTVIRAADAAGCDAVVFVDDCVDVLNPKVIRSTAGSLFHLPVLTMGTEEFFTWTAVQHVDVWAADVYGTPERKPESLPTVLAELTEAPGATDGTEAIADATAAESPSPQTSRAVLFGNEARGLETEILRRCDRIVSIPLYGKAESLNLGTSAAVMLMSLAMSRHIETM